MRQCEDSENVTDAGATREDVRCVDVKNTGVGCADVIRPPVLEKATVTIIFSIFKQVTCTSFLSGTAKFR